MFSKIIISPPDCYSYATSISSNKFKDCIKSWFAGCVFKQLKTLRCLSALCYLSPKHMSDMGHSTKGFSSACQTISPQSTPSFQTAENIADIMWCGATHIYS